MADRSFRAYRADKPRTETLAIGTLHDNGTVDVMYRGAERLAGSMGEVEASLAGMSSTGVDIVWEDEPEAGDE